MSLVSQHIYIYIFSAGVFVGAVSGRQVLCPVLLLSRGVPCCSMWVLLLLVLVCPSECSSVRVLLGSTYLPYMLETGVKGPQIH